MLDHIEPIDAVDRILLREAEPALAIARQIVVIDDESCALAGLVADTVGARGVCVRAYTDSATTERALAELARRQPDLLVAAELDASLLEKAEVVLLRLPKSLAALDAIAAAVARFAAPRVQVYAAGRVRHMTRGMNARLARHFTSVRASLGQQKARVLVASGARSDGPAAEPQVQRHDDLAVTLVAYGGTFAGSEVDLGSRLLIQCFDRLPVAPGLVVDLGSGSGLLAVLVAQQRPHAQVIATDDSRAAVRSTIATAAANGVGDRVSGRHSDRLNDLRSRSVDLVVCNPPFHRGTARDSSAAYAMVADAARVLRPGGELWVVFNSHLPYLTALRRDVGGTTILTQNPRFTVARAVRRQQPHVSRGPSPHTAPTT